MKNNSTLVHHLSFALGLAATVTSCGMSKTDVSEAELIAQGKEAFRHDTFGDEALWTETLRLHEVIPAAVDPTTALSVGLKVDAEALPDGILDTADLSDPATTVALLKLDAVVGLKAKIETVSGVDTLTSVGVTCALCHSNVDDSVAPGIGRRRDGWPNRDLDAGLILSLSPALQDQKTQAALKSWGPGKYDAYWNQDGKSDPAVIPPAYGLAGIENTTYTGEGDISYWNAYVAVTQMGGLGNFEDPRLGLNISNTPDLVTPKLPALRAYQHSLPAPPPPPGSFDTAKAERGKTLFSKKAQCANCHAGDKFTDADERLHAPSEIGIDPLLAERGTTGKYRTSPLAGIWQHPPYFHNGSAETLQDVVTHYNDHFALGLTPDEQDDLVHFLRSL